MYYRKLTVNGVDHPLAVNITGAGEPTSATEALVGMFYMNTENGDVYKCVSAIDGIYEWIFLVSSAKITAMSPAYAASIEDMTDTSKVYIGSNGNLWTYMSAITVTKNYTNLADPTSSDWVANMELNSSGNPQTTSVGCVVTNFIPTGTTLNNKIRVRGMGKLDKKKSGIYDASKAFLRSQIAYSNTDETYHNVPPDYDEETDTLTFNMNNTTAAYYRFCGVPTTSVEDIIITLNEEITETVTEGMQWCDTGIKYAHYAMTDDDYECVADKVLDRLDVSYVSSDKMLTVGTYTFRYDGEGIADIGVTE